MYVEDSEMRPDRLIFIYEPAQRVSMWMKNTLLPLDVVCGSAHIVSLHERCHRGRWPPSTPASHDAGGRTQGRDGGGAVFARRDCAPDTGPPNTGLHQPRNAAVVSGRSSGRPACVAARTQRLPFSSMYLATD
jgi:hypothetical protein